VLDEVKEDAHSLESDPENVYKLNGVIGEVCTKAGSKGFDLVKLAQYCVDVIFLEEPGQTLEEEPGDELEFEYALDNELRPLLGISVDEREVSEELLLEDVCTKMKELSGNDDWSWSDEGVGKRRIKKPPDPEQYMNWMSHDVVVKSGVFAHRAEILVEDSERYGMDLNNWGNLGKKKSFKKRKKKKSLSGLCFKNFKWHKSNNTWVVTSDYEPILEQHIEV
jgi:hypothetical protein